ncbi:MAG: preprotein translocase subunit YajC [Pseudomonadota bacterium]
MFIDVAYAMASNGQAGGESPGLLQMLLPIILMIAVFYFIVIRPQTKKQKTHQNFVSALKRGDEVITAGGIYGKVAGVTDEFITLEIANNVRIRISKSSVAASGKIESSEPAAQQNANNKK